jgi:hypothetical protein
MLTKTHRRFVFIVWIWGGVCLTLQFLISTSDALYDSGGWRGLLWWIGQAIFLPIYGISEALAALGIQTTAGGGYAIITAFVVFVLTGFVFFRSLRENENNIDDQL